MKSNPTILERIVARKEVEVAALPPCPAANELQRKIQERGLRPFLTRLRSASPPPGIIAEIKKASPSAGVICPDFDPVRIARAYQAAGADCLSVLTDRDFFHGSLDDLHKIREAVELPLLRKDFIIDARQLPESIEAGADAILLIVAILNDRQLEKLFHLATSIGFSVLVEVHDEAELYRALSLPVQLLGINNRDLKSFQVDLRTTARLSALIPANRGILVVSESGIKTRADVEQILGGGARALLVGEHLMRSADLPGEMKRLRGTARALE